MAARVSVTVVNNPDLDIERSVFEAAGLTLDFFDNHEDVINWAGGADALLTEYVSLSAGVFEALPDFRIADAATEHDIQMVNNPTYFIEKVGTLAIDLLLTALRRLPIYHATVAAGEWDWTVERPIRRLWELALNLVACRNISRRAAATMQAFGVNAVGYDPYVSGSMFEECGEVIGNKSLAVALADEDVKFMHPNDLSREPPVDSHLSSRDSVLVTPQCGRYSETSIVKLRRNVASDGAAVLQGDATNSVKNDEEVAR